jgi:hypothetical protein
MKQSLILMLTLFSQFSHAQQMWKFLDASHDGNKLHVASVLVKNKSAQVTFMIRVENGKLIMLLNCNKKVKSGIVNIKYADPGEFISVPVYYTPGMEGYSLTINADPQEVLGPTAYVKYTTIMIDFKDLGPVNFIIPTDPSTLNFLSQ